MPLRPRLPANKTPWPLKWVALAILLMIVPYTFLTVAYRKPGPAYEPYEAAKNNADPARLIAAGYRRIETRLERPSDPERYRNLIDTTAQITDADPGLSPELVQSLGALPMLPQQFSSVLASAESHTRLPYQFLFVCVLPDTRRQLSGAELYRKGDQLIVVPRFEPLEGDLSARSKESPALLTVSAAALPTGRYTVTLAGSLRSKAWALEVKE
jgi:hypothetical protein